MTDASKPCDAKPTCPKCGGRMGKGWYCTGMYGCTLGVSALYARDHLHRRCLYCGYETTEPALDAKEAH